MPVSDRDAVSRVQCPKNECAFEDKIFIKFSLVEPMFMM